MVGEQSGDTARFVDNHAIGVDDIRSRSLADRDEVCQAIREIELVCVEPTDPSPRRFRQRLVEGVGLAFVGLRRPLEVGVMPREYRRSVIR
jgi:hypothetical protein